MHDNPIRDYVGRINEGSYAACRRAGYYLLPERLTLTASDRLEELDLFLDTSRVDGVVLSPPLADDALMIGHLKARGVPFVLLSPEDSDSGFLMVKRDQKSAAYEMTEHLISLGHKRIAFVSGPRSHGAAITRRVGFEEAMAAAGLPPGPVVDGDFSFRSGSAAGEDLLSGPERPTAIFAANDHMAAGVMAYALKAGLSVPGDLSVAGFDATEMGEAMWPPLTTIRQPLEEMGKEAASLLMEPSARGEDGSGASSRGHFELIVRGSTGAVPE